MNVTFSVPQFPQFKHTPSHDEYVKYENYMKRFQAYSVASLQMQVKSFKEAAEILSAGDGSKAMELNLLKMNEVVSSLAASASGIVERSTVAMDEEMAGAARSIRLDVERVMSESVSEVKSMIESSRPVFDNGSADVCDQHSTCWQSADANVASGKNNRRNRLRRDKRKTKQSASSGGVEADSVQPEVKGGLDAGDEAKDSDVPEWRRVNARGTFHKGAFSECPVNVRDSLRDSRAEMLIAKNKAASVEAEARCRQIQAKLKSRLLEEEVERTRLEHDKKIRILRDEASSSQGFAETIVSALETPSLSDGSISPDSSISVAEVQAKDRAIRLLISQCTEKNSELEKLKARMEKIERHNNNAAF